MDPIPALREHSDKLLAELGLSLGAHPIDATHSTCERLCEDSR